MYGAEGCSKQELDEPITLRWHHSPNSRFQAIYQHPPGIYKDIISPEVMVDQGVICIPEKPGIGYEVDRGLIDNYSLGCYEFIL